MLGVFEKRAAVHMARQQDLDLVEVSPNADPPVCKILDFGKYKYELTKKSNEAKKRQKTTEVKEVKLRPNIASGDLLVKLNNARRFIEEGNKVKVSLFFKGREITHSEVGIEVMNKFKEEASSFSKIELDMKKEGKQIFLILAPNKINP